MTNPSEARAANEVQAIPPVEKSIRVPLPPEQAFRRFTENMGDWWPLARYSVGLEEARGVVFEGRTGGRIYEVQTDGTEADWGRVTVWEPSRRVAFTWHPGRPESTRQEVAVTFRPEADGTRVELVHSGWERLPEKPLETREQYRGGWDFVLGRYAAT